MLTIIFERPGVDTRIVQIPDEQLQAFRSSIQELRDEIADRIGGRYEYRREGPWSRAIAALGTFAGGLNRMIPEGGDPQFGPRANLWPEERS